MNNNNYSINHRYSADCYISYALVFYLYFIILLILEVPLILLKIQKIIILLLLFFFIHIFKSNSLESAIMHENTACIPFHLDITLPKNSL